METLSSDFVENKGVPTCKRIDALQFPSGDDVSDFHPLRSSVAFNFLDAETQNRIRKIYAREEPCKLKEDVLLCKDDCPVCHSIY
jgi:hypothetical protein